MLLSFDPLQSAIPQSLHAYLLSSRSYTATLRWMALAGAKLPNIDVLVRQHLLRSAPRKALSEKRKRFLVDEASELGTTLQQIRSLIPLDYSYLLEVLCILFWESNSVQGPGLQSDQKHSLPANDPSPVARPATSRPMTSSPMAVDPPGNNTGNRYLDLFLDEDGAFPIQRP